MNDLTAAINREIESCSELLKVFQQERQLYCGSAGIGIAEVSAILSRKKQLVEIFDRQHLLVKSLGGQDSAAQAENKELMRRLGAVLEQLLVIDHENEKLLRDSISSRRIGGETRPVEPEIPQRARPALQRQMPFVPGNRPTEPLTPPARTAAAPRQRPSTSVAAVPAAPATGERATAAGRHLLRNYVRNSPGLTSKYA